MKERIVALGLFVFSLIFLAGALALKVGTMAQPDAGFMPAAVGASLLVAAAYNLVQQFRQPVAANQGKAGGLALAPSGIAAATLVYPVLLSFLNYLTSTFLVLAALLLLLRFKSPLVGVLTALAAALASFVFFGKLLNVVLPSGALEDAILAL
jgi:hypothetical protein